MSVIPLTQQGHLHLAARETGGTHAAMSWPVDANGARVLLKVAGIDNPDLVAAIDLDTSSAFASGVGGWIGVFHCDGDCDATAQEITRSAFVADGTGGR